MGLGGCSGQWCLLVLFCFVCSLFVSSFSLTLMSVCFCLSVCLSSCLDLSVFLFVYLRLFACLCMSVFLRIDASVNRCCSTVNRTSLGKCSEVDGFHSSYYPKLHHNTHFDSIVTFNYVLRKKRFWRENPSSNLHKKSNLVKHFLVLFCLSFLFWNL